MGTAPIPRVFNLRAGALRSRLVNRDEAERLAAVARMWRHARFGAVIRIRSVNETQELDAGQPIDLAVVGLDSDGVGVAIAGLDAIGPGL